jgi:hypothetical protein
MWNDSDVRVDNDGDVSIQPTDIRHTESTGARQETGPDTEPGKCPGKTGGMVFRLADYPGRIIKIGLPGQRVISPGKRGRS